jgi:hypothetical protein
MHYHEDEIQIPETKITSGQGTIVTIPIIQSVYFTTLLSTVSFMEISVWMQSFCAKKLP